ncbi:DNA-binding MarR family transcriptional regulator [Jatrophihabitans sp. GAS493]|uniref:MarR family winged helix-turn-helix transcriptional regulator n=1 Tax=Jatrophihabitans sp. GAS493 TaxID=1907575 RepID=UPI000BC089C9|nr:MarR family transcriptional regulator [Jatrophihabitans sp. GAS493]SOD72007.1 DNA-binding MarR family transcriptional regulator [Jatrophihabitans sp. GAS493]
MTEDVPPIDPIYEARRQWAAHGWDDAADGMAIVTGITRVHQIFMGRVDAVLRPMGLTFARYELLVLLSFSRKGAMTMKRIGSLLQVHPTSVTSVVDRLESQGFVQRRADTDDGRSVRVHLLKPGRRIAAEATEVLNAEVFEKLGLKSRDLQSLARILTGIRSSAGDF